MALVARGNVGMINGSLGEQVCHYKLSLPSLMTLSSSILSPQYEVDHIAGSSLLCLLGYIDVSFVSIMKVSLFIMVLCATSLPHRMHHYMSWSYLFWKADWHELPFFPGIWGDKWLYMALASSTISGCYEVLVRLGPKSH